MNLTGKRTYILAALAAVLTAVKYLGYVSEDQYNTLLALLGSGAVATLRASIDKKAIIFIFMLLTPSLVSAQTVVTKGPVDTSMKFNWENPSNITLADAPTFEYRLRDTFFPGIVTVIAGAQCVAGTPVICTAPLTQANADALNKVGSHSLTLSLFRQDVGESFQSIPFGLPSGPPTAPTNLRIIKSALLSIFKPIGRPLVQLSRIWAAGH